jgi:hypothetical protein
MDDRDLNTQPKPFVFVLMPFDQKFQDVYQLGIRAVCEAEGAHCERVDEQVFEGGILERIYNQISRADIIIAEMTDRNPNVFYEVGYAHALGKRVIPITQDVDAIPFDLRNYPHVVYAGISRLMPALAARLRWCIDHPGRPLVLVDQLLNVFHNGTDIAAAGKVELPCPERHRDLLYLQLDFNNASHHVYPAGSVRAGLITPAKLWNSRDTERIVLLGDGRYLHILRQLDGMFPGEWRSLSFSVGASAGPMVFGPRNEYLNPGEVFSVTLRLFAQLGPRDVNFSIELVPR